MTMLLWALLAALLVVVVLALSPRLRKSAFIWTSYVTITGWYYFRVLHKKYSGAKDAPVSSPRSTPRTSSAAAKTVDEPRDPDLVYFESRDVVTRRQQELHDRLERSGVSERSSHMSESGSSSGSDTSGPRSRKKSIFHSNRKAAAEEAMRRVSDSNSNDLLSSSNVSEDLGTTTRRTYVGRKKPVSWAD